ncbi:hypothetical protein midi_01137 [Candidatus Midichloria mitochondrii IricVA]|uniref:Uncharacterized protein n=1 Tax=Midichloria mitochondrii (strain IricVA) TaxID=696127 RepID=F7XU55_MIDMI|nr:hypothetical protein midi_01137 [Candidatus Midichloria mitochondrii IricVA]
MGCFNRSAPCKEQLFKSCKRGVLFFMFFLSRGDELNTLIAQCFC